MQLETIEKIERALLILFQQWFDGPCVKLNGSGFCDSPKRPQIPHRVTFARLRLKFEFLFRVACAIVGGQHYFCLAQK